MENDYFIDLTVKLSTQTLDINEVPISCIITYNNRIISYGYNNTNKDSNPLAHAEVVALKKLNFNIFNNPENNKINSLEIINHEELKEIIQPIKFTNNNEFRIYISCEPCAMCYGILERLPIKIYYACKNNQFGCSNICNLDGGTLLFRKEAVYNLRKFFLKENVLAPEDKRKSKKNRIFKDKI